MANISPLPRESDWISSDTDTTSGKRRLSGKLSSSADNWLQELISLINQTPKRIVSISLADQSDDILTTPLPLPSGSSGLYRVGYLIRQTQVATVSLDLQVTIGWTQGGVSMADAGAVLSGNTTGTHETRWLLVKRDGGASAISYAVAYTSVGATPGKFQIDLVCEAL